MLNAILNGKKRGSGIAGMDFPLGEASGAEDILTATVFERLSYLPDAVLQQVLSGLLPSVDCLGLLTRIEYWPSWWLGGRRIEPDVVLRTTTCDILVEAKRWDYAEQQYAEQLASELKAGWAEKQLRPGCHVLTVGGMLTEGDAVAMGLHAEVTNLLGADSPPFTLAGCSWRKLYQVMAAAICKHSSETSLQRLLSDVAQAYAWHNLRLDPMRLLDALQPAGIEHADGRQFPKLFPGLSTSGEVPGQRKPEGSLMALSCPQGPIGIFHIPRFLT